MKDDDIEEVDLLAALASSLRRAKSTICRCGHAQISHSSGLCTRCFRCENYRPREASR